MSEIAALEALRHPKPQNGSAKGTARVASIEVHVGPAMLTCLLWQTAPPNPRKPANLRLGPPGNLPVETVSNPHFSQKTREMGHPPSRVRPNNFSATKSGALPSPSFGR